MNFVSRTRCSAIALHRGRDLRGRGACDDPGSATHHFVVRCARETYHEPSFSAFSICGVSTAPRFSGVIGPTSL